MVTRTRTIPDTAVLEAAHRAITRLGPNDCTLADIAAEAGLAAPTLVQRFGSKRRLLVALAQMAAEGAGACFTQVRAAHRSPLRALYGCIDQMACLAPTPEALAHGLAFLQMDLTDPEFRRWSVVSSDAVLAGYRELLDDAIGAGELTPCDSEGMARLIQAAIHGSMVTWAFYQQGTAAKWMLRDLELLLRPYLPKKKRRRYSG
jgi:AcrR family transcriptional regulator